MEGPKEPPVAPSFPVSYDNNPGASPFHHAPPPIQQGVLPGSTLPQPGLYNQPPPAYQEGIPVVYGQNPYQQQPAQNIRVIHTEGRFGAHPINTTCMNCNANVVTRTTSTTSTKQCLIGLILAAAGFWCCACIPCCLDEWNEVCHYCPNCNVLIGRNRQDC